MAQGSRQTWMQAGLAAGLLALAGLVVATPASAQAVRGTLLGNDHRHVGRDRARRHRRRSPKQGTNIVTTRRHQRERVLHVPESARMASTASKRELSGFKKVVRDNVQVDVNTTIRVDLSLEAGNVSRNGDRRRRDAGAADRPRRHRPPDRGRADRRDAARLRPQLPGHAGDGAGRVAPVPAALGVLQLAGLALDQRQRPVAPRQQRA